MPARAAVGFGVIVSCAALLPATAWSRPAPFGLDAAGQSLSASPFELEAGREAKLLSAGLMVGVASKMFGVERRAGSAHLRSPDAVNPIDRGVIGNRSDLAGGASDVLLAAHLALPHAASLLDAMINRPSDGLTGAFVDSAVLLETISVTFLLTDVVKYSVRRPRPYMYDPSASEAERGEVNSTLSFFSGHTAPSFSMATAYSYLFTLRHPDSPWVAPVWIGTHALATTTALMRVLAGRHYWSDVAVGAVVGSAIGFTVPYVHTAAGRDTLLAKIEITPIFYEGGFGASLWLPW